MSSQDLFLPCIVKLTNQIEVHQMGKPVILLTGAAGQIGSVLTQRLRETWGRDQVIASDIKYSALAKEGPFEILDALDYNRLEDIVLTHKVTRIYHLVAILSASGEKNPLRTWDINMNSWLNVLEVAKNHKLERLFYPSSIAVFGPDNKKNNTPQDEHLAPTTVYGLSKVAGENWGNYYSQKYGLDVRSLRYPGLISHQTLPGGGTTDYAIDIFHKAVQDEPYSCFLSADSRLPMLYMDDALRGTIELMNVDKNRLKPGRSYNLGGLDFTPKELATAIQKFIPDFKIVYAPDERQAIADSWPASIDDSEAQKDWGWQPTYNIDKMCKVMIDHLKKKLTPKTSKV